MQQGYLLFNQSDPVCNTYPQILKQQTSVPQMNEIVNSLAEARRNNTNKMRTEDIWLGDVQRWGKTLELLLNPNKGENSMKESYWPSWVLEA